METPIVKIRGMSKAFTGVQALSNVKLNLYKGEAHALMGENGAGKSTLMKCLIGVQAADTGTITYKDQEVQFESVLKAQEDGISMIFQELNLIPHLTVAENIFFAREPLKGGLIDYPKMEHDAKALLAEFDIDVEPTDIVNTLSVAKQQLVEIAKSLSFDVEVLIMDEPTSALTDKEIEALFRLVEQLKSQGVAIVYISHRMDEIQQICERITIFRDGQYVSDHLIADITMDDIIAKMVGRTLDEKYPARTCRPSEDVIMSVRDVTRHGVFAPISFELKKGEILGITGLVGAKRTELARALFGADPLDGGEISIHGTDIEISSPKDAIAAGIAYLSEDRKRHGIAVGMSVRENTTMATLEKVSNSSGVISHALEVEAANRYINKMGIKTPTVEQVVKNLSGGNQQKVVIGKWLFNGAKVMIFDEPTRGIDVGAKFAIYQLLDELAAQGVGVIMISSELPEVLGLADRIVVMKEGSMTAILDSEHTDQEGIMQYATGYKNQFEQEAVV